MISVSPKYVPYYHLDWDSCEVIIEEHLTISNSKNFSQDLYTLSVITKHFFAVVISYIYELLLVLIWLFHISFAGIEEF